MFQNAQSFNQDVDSWTPISVKKFENMFNGASRFDGKIFDQTNEAVTMTSMFEGASSFTGKNAENMVTNKVDNMQSMFKSATVFNAAIPNSGTKWSVALVTTMESMFEGASSFNKPLDTWTLGGAGVVVTSGLKSMFKNAVAFNSLTFKVDNTLQTTATDVTSMFEGAAAFNQDISGWTVTAITTFTNMFKDASSFNQNIAIWDMTAATTSAGLTNMFVGASNFQQNLCDWNARITAAITATEMFSSPNKCPNADGVFIAATTPDGTTKVCCSCDAGTPDAGFTACA